MVLFWSGLKATAAPSRVFPSQDFFGELVSFFLKIFVFTGHKGLRVAPSWNGSPGRRSLLNVA